ncbi:hypothetical protein J2W83_002656 [Pseudomonas hunanensis]|uniref:Uncharacterized protein n=1 Tax=Pseudomonas hunanensis TaxID=1247546 RepID=A0ACC6K3M2_9PSED|nr:hypothetical protein [Pseudomonas hunanensis]
MLCDFGGKTKPADANQGSKTQNGVWQVWINVSIAHPIGLMMPLVKS